MKSPPISFSLASLGFGGNLSQLFFVNISSIILRPDKYNILSQSYLQTSIKEKTVGKNLMATKIKVCFNGAVKNGMLLKMQPGFEKVTNIFAVKHVLCISTSFWVMRVGFGYTYNPSLICDYKMYRENQ